MDVMAALDEAYRNIPTPRPIVRRSRIVPAGEPFQARPVIAVRLSRSGITALETRAKAEGLSRSELMRRMLAYAQRMPKGWKP